MARQSLLKMITAGFAATVVLGFFFTAIAKSTASRDGDGGGDGGSGKGSAVATAATLVVAAEAVAVEALDHHAALLASSGTADPGNAGVPATVSLTFFGGVLATLLRWAAEFNAWGVREPGHLAFTTGLFFGGLGWSCLFVCVLKGLMARACTHVVLWAHDTNGKEDVTLAACSPSIFSSRAISCDCVRRHAGAACGAA